MRASPYLSDRGGCQVDRIYVSAQDGTAVGQSFIMTVAGGRSLVDASRVQQLHDYYLDLLAYEVERNHLSTHSRILIKIFQLLPLLVPINAEQAVAIMNLRVDAPPGQLTGSLIRVSVLRITVRLLNS